MVTAYRHEPFTDFTIEENKQAIQEALRNLNSQLGEHFPLVIGGERIQTEEQVISYNPANKTEVIGTVSKVNKELAEKAMQVALETFETWKNWDPESRARILFKAAAIIRRRKQEFNAYLVKEGGKPWKEADGETAECIDFLEYYGRQMLRLKNGSKVNSRANEFNTFTYIPLGVGIVISPFNFSLAIMGGTTVAAIVTGNTVLLKPSDRTPVVAAKFVEVMEEAGLPAGVLNYIPGAEPEIGDYLVGHPKTRFVSFTGSRAVGCHIYEHAAKVQPGQKWLKRVIAEMGGKDTVVVDESADIDLAVESIVYSAFGYAGQKCSAGSRAVVHEKIYDEVLEKCVALTKTLTVGTPEEGQYMGPVIDKGQFDKIMNYIEIGKGEGRLVTGGEGDDSIGYFIQPTIIADVDEKARIMQEEIFGPVLAFCKAKDMDHLMEIANNTEYGLTGAFLSKNQAHLERARREFHVGNLYLNRGCTAAIVGYQPFGGFNMSGTDSKAGGPDYLIQHMQAKSIGEQL
ncbi:L-glutamate gamma-semialdehyde dehydrogenase [Pullulanibacillus sp. KACC 23026]|uniref:L-glutamate gamma-semialdehyde dehydrogenase n=1 Tax=Pullulanibacillus sp. KACC 23026 TaxID=3028315 RepID=UPI0023B0363E|nr:L-glutamate gamma-semialdehyde dehydrogenase [Pullulanibacillus sp. KACC 23026]WEG12956.1 L-glutamate gamma-semialdehyde dehydrogenase [Pullulanibacillus sp. KACC 23026]